MGAMWRVHGYHKNWSFENIFDVSEERGNGNRALRREVLYDVLRLCRQFCAVAKSPKSFANTSGCVSYKQVVAECVERCVENQRLAQESPHTNLIYKPLPLGGILSWTIQRRDSADQN